MATDSSSTRTTSLRRQREHRRRPLLLHAGRRRPRRRPARGRGPRSAGGSRLVQLYPTPIVTARHVPMRTTGDHDHDLRQVLHRGLRGHLRGRERRTSFHRRRSTATITAKVPPGTSGATVDVQVSTPGGSSLDHLGSDQFRYDPSSAARRSAGRRRPPAPAAVSLSGFVASAVSRGRRAARDRAPGAAAARRRRRPPPAPASSPEPAQRSLTGHTSHSPMSIVTSRLSTATW